MPKRCDMCFQPKETLMPVLPKMPTNVCKACSYKIGQVIAFLEYHNATLSYQPELSKETPPTPPSSELSALGRPKKAKKTAKAPLPDLTDSKQ